MRFDRRTQIAALLAAVAIAGQLVLLWVRQTAPQVSGDEGTFLAMTASLAIDGDLEFDVADRNRLEAARDSGRQAVILQRAGSEITYSKPALFPLLAAPWYRLWGESGVLLLNALCLAGALALAGVFLRRRWGAEPAGLAVVTFAGPGVLLSYVAWTMSDSLQASLTLGGAALALGFPREESDRNPVARAFSSNWAAVTGGLLLGMAVSMRYPNLLPAAAAPLALMVSGRRRRAVLAALGIALMLGGGLMLNRLLAGSTVPYKAVRATFNAETGYPAGEGADDRMEHFQTARATHRLGMVPRWEAQVSLYSAAYFLVGRHSGVVVYLPAALVFAASALGLGRRSRRDRIGLVLVATAAALAAFYLVWMPRNYFGGATFLGNRYFLTGYVVLLLAPLRPPSRRALAAVWVIAGLAFLSATLSAARVRDVDRTSQMHAYAGIFRKLPYESTALDIDGRRDRYWSDELVRFVDPYARVGEQGFKLFSGSPPAELVTAGAREHGVIRFLVQADAPEVEIVYRDWLQTKRFRLIAAVGGARGFLEIVPSVTVRRHAYWWDPESPLAVRSMNLSLETPDGRPASAEVRYAGPYRFVPRFYRAEVEAIRIPGRGRAGTIRRVPVRLRNLGSRYWATDDPIPILLGYRLFASPRRDSEPVAIGPFTPLSAKVAPGSSTDLQMDLVWPPSPGRYELAVDLVVAGLNWFEEWNGAPLAKRQILVLEEHDSTQ